MRATNSTEFRKNLSDEFDRVENDREPLIVTRSGGKAAMVILSLEEFGSWEATQHLLKSPENARRLREAIKRFENGGGTVRKLVE